MNKLIEQEDYEQMLQELNDLAKAADIVRRLKMERSFDNLEVMK